MASISWSATAQNNLIEIFKFVSEQSLAQADLVIDSIIEKVNILERFPEMGKPVKELPGKGYRELLVKSYRVIYFIEEEKVNVITIHHSARLLKNNPTFKEEDL
jgi:toxin ParE1/3/4